MYDLVEAMPRHEAFGVLNFQAKARIIDMRDISPAMNSVCKVSSSTPGRTVIAMRKSDFAEHGPLD